MVAQDDLLVEGLQDARLIRGTLEDGAERNDEIGSLLGLYGGGLTLSYSFFSTQKRAVWLFLHSSRSLLEAQCWRAGDSRLVVSMSSSSSQPSTQSSAHRKGTDYYDLESIIFSQTVRSHKFRFSRSPAPAPRSNPSLASVFAQVAPLTAAVNIHGLGFLDPSGQDEVDVRMGIFGFRLFEALSTCARLYDALTRFLHFLSFPQEPSSSFHSGWPNLWSQNAWLPRRFQKLTMLALEAT